MNSYWQDLTLIGALVLLNAFFAAGEIAVISVRPIRLKQLAEQGSTPARLLLKLTKDHSRFLATIQVGITLAGMLASASAAVGMATPVAAALRQAGLAAPLAQTLALFGVTVGVSYVTLVLGELVPKRMALQAPERIALFVARPVSMVARVAGPFTSFLTWSTNLVVRLLGGKTDQQEPTISEEELRFYVAEHDKLEAEEKQLIEGVFDFGDLQVRHMMVPRMEMDCVHQDSPISHAIKQVKKAGFWRFPVYREDYDDIVGIVTVKDLLRPVCDEQTEAPVHRVMRPPFFVPEGKRALSLLKEMQSRDEQMAIVIDEYGGVAGLVTLEDLLQEIVGDVRHEPAPRPDGRPAEYLLDAGESMEEVNERLDAKLPPSPHYETLAGFMLHQFGEIPQVGASLEVQGWRLVVERLDGLRIEQVRAIPALLPPAIEAAESQERHH